MCQEAETKWLGAVFFWANDVQGASEFDESLNKFVSNGFKRSASVVSGADFASGTGGRVNNGWWSATPHENSKRVANFDMIIDAFKSAGMT